jgi:alpha-tubulin suppressor-like RCC1 family protein
MLMANSIFAQYSLWTWGSNEYGQLGNDRPEDEPLPVIVNEDGDWEKIYSFYAIKKDGTLWTWGGNKINKINDNEDISIRLFDDSKWKEIFTNNSFTTYGIKDDGSLWSWGEWSNGWRITEKAENNDENKFIQKPFLIDSTHKWKSFSFSTYMCSAIDEQGRLYTWGVDSPNMGIGKLDTMIIDSITQIGNDSDWVKTNYSGFHTIGLKTDGSLWVWGKDTKPYFEERDKQYYEPIKLGDFNCKDFTTSADRPYDASLLVFIDKENMLQILNKGLVLETILESNSSLEFGKTDGSCVALYGDSYTAFLGHNMGLRFTSLNNEEIVKTPFIIDSEYGLNNLKDIAQVRFGFVAIDSNSNLIGWGDNTYGALTNGKSSVYKEPINIMPDKLFKDISCGATSSLAIDEYGMMWVWGDNSSNRLGLKDVEKEIKPVPINNDTDWEKVFALKNNNYAIKKDGSLWAWGYGYLGVGGEEKLISEPTKVKEDGPWKKVHSTDNHTLALKEDGSLWAWGLGKDAMGIEIDRALIPYKVNDDNDWIDIIAGSNYSIAMKADSSVWGWGKNRIGVFGTDPLLVLSEPTKIIPECTGEISTIVGGKSSMLAKSLNNKLYLISSGTCSEMEFDGEAPNSFRYMQTNYNGYNIVISEEGNLYNSLSYYHSRPEALDIKPLLFEQFGEDNDWIKATIGDDHIIALRGDYITNVREPRKLVNADIYPNPSVSNINIDFDSFYSNVNVSIYDVYGKLVLEDKSYNTDRISINHNLPRGAYILQCSDENDLIVDQVLVVE